MFFGADSAISLQLEIKHHLKCGECRKQYKNYHLCNAPRLHSEYNKQTACGKTEKTAGERKQQSFKQKFQQDTSLRGSERFFDANFSCPLADRDKHHGHNAQTCYQQRNGSHCRKNQCD